MGAGQAHPAHVAKVDTGCLLACHSDLKAKYGCGAAALALKGDTLFVAGNKGLGVFCAKIKGELPRIGNVMNTGAIGRYSGCALAFYQDQNVNLMYVAGGNGLAVLDVTAGYEAPKKLTDGVLDTGALTYNGGAALCLVGDYLYVAGGHGLAVLDVKTNPVAPKKIGDTIDTGALTSRGGAAMKLVERDAGAVCKLLYVVGGNGLAVMDLGPDPTKPVRIGEVLNTGCVSHIGCGALSDSGSEDVLFVAGGHALGILNVKDPKCPTLAQKMNTGVLATNGGSAMLTDTSTLLYGPTNTLLIAGGNGLGVFTLPPPQDMLSGVAPTRMGKIDTGALSYDNDSAILLDDTSRLLYVAGGNGLAVFDLEKFDGATLQTDEISVELS